MLEGHWKASLPSQFSVLVSCRVFASAWLPLSLSQDERLKADSLATTGLIKKFKLDQAARDDNQLFCDDQDREAAELLASTSDIDEAVHLALANKLLKMESGEDGPQVQEPPADITIGEAHVDLALRLWSGALVESLSVIEAANAAKDTPLGGHSEPLQISFVWKPPDVLPIHWSDRASLLGRACRIDADGRIVWPTSVNSERIDCTGLHVIHPAVGVRARRVKVDRPVLPTDMRRLKRMYESKYDPLKRLPAFAICYVCGLANAPRGTESDAEYDTSITRTCSMCLLDYHNVCMSRVSDGADEETFFGTWCAQAPMPAGGLPPPLAREFGDNDMCFLCSSWLQLRHIVRRLSNVCDDVSWSPHTLFPLGGGRGAGSFSDCKKTIWCPLPKLELLSRCPEPGGFNSFVQASRARPSQSC